MLEEDDISIIQNLHDTSFKTQLLYYNLPPMFGDKVYR